MVCNMPLIVGTAWSGGFSETARSRPRLDEARRHARHRPAIAEVRRRFPDDVAEGPAERPQAREPDLHAHIGDAAVARPQEVHGSFDTARWRYRWGVSPN